MGRNTSPETGPKPTTSEMADNEHNLKKEGIEKGRHLVGDTMYDAVLQFSEIAKARSHILEKLEIKAGEYYLATVHRPYNTDNLETLKEILRAFMELDKAVVFPVHPRTKSQMDKLSFDLTPNTLNLKFISPIGYLDMLRLEGSASMILTDSGGMQKEAYFLGVPCITLRLETEWVRRFNKSGGFGADAANFGLKAWSEG